MFPHAGSSHRQCPKARSAWEGLREEHGTSQLVSVRVAPGWVGGGQAGSLMTKAVLSCLTCSFSPGKPQYSPHFPLPSLLGKLRSALWTWHIGYRSVGVWERTQGLFPLMRYGPRLALLAVGHPRKPELGLVRNFHKTYSWNSGTFPAYAGMSTPPVLPPTPYCSCIGRNLEVDRSGN